MKTTDNITVTDGRLHQALNKQVTRMMMPKVNKNITNAVNESKFQIGIMTKFYPYLDKCEVKIGDDLILCKILHRFMGDLIDYHTPIGDEDYCSTLNEPCIIPLTPLECVIVDVNDNTDEWIMVGYVNSEELIGLNPASMGNLKLVSISAENQFWIKFGLNGLNIRSPNAPTTSVGEYDKDMIEIGNVNSTEVYTKEETDELIKNAIDELKQEIMGVD